MSNTLLPCPFCGGEAEIVGGPENWTPTFYDPDSGGDPIAVVCKTCACGLHFFDGYAEAASAWNRRAQPENKPLALDELRGMDGEIVYCIPLNDWAKVTKYGLLFFGTEDYRSWREIEDSYGVLWWALRSKPKEEDSCSIKT